MGCHCLLQLQGYQDIKANRWDITVSGKMEHPGWASWFHDVILCAVGTFCHWSLTFPAPQLTVPDLLCSHVQPPRAVKLVHPHESQMTRCFHKRRQVAHSFSPIHEDNKPSSIRRGSEDFCPLSFLEPHPKATKKETIVFKWLKQESHQKPLNNKLLIPSTKYYVSGYEGAWRGTIPTTSDLG